MGKTDDDTNVSAPPGTWRATEYTEEQNQEFNRFRRSFFDGLIQVSEQMITRWELDLQGTRLIFHIQGDGESQKSLAIRLLFSPCFNSLYLQIAPFEVHRRPAPPGWKSVEEYLRKHHNPEQIRIGVAPGKIKKTLLVDLSMAIPITSGAKLFTLLIGVSNLLQILVQRTNFIRRALE